MEHHESFFSSLSEEEHHLLALKDLLYEGSWEEIEIDLKARKDNKPYVVKLDSRIDEDLLRIEKLRAYEDEKGVDLGLYLPHNQSAQN